MKKKEVPYVKILKHLKNYGVGIRVEIIDFLREELQTDENILTMTNSLDTDGLIRRSRNIGPVDGLLYSIKAEITKGGLEHLDKINIYKFSKWALGISIAGIVFTAATYLKEYNKPDNKSPHIESKISPALKKFPTHSSNKDTSHKISVQKKP